MFKIKNYKKLYKEALENNKVMQERNAMLYKDKVELQIKNKTKDEIIANLNEKNEKNIKEIRKLKNVLKNINVKKEK